MQEFHAAVSCQSSSFDILVHVTLPRCEPRFYEVDVSVYGSLTNVSWNHFAQVSRAAVGLPLDSRHAKIDLNRR